MGSSILEAKIRWEVWTSFTDVHGDIITTYKGYDDDGALAKYWKEVNITTGKIKKTGTFNYSIIAEPSNGNSRIDNTVTNLNNEPFDPKLNMNQNDDDFNRNTDVIDIASTHAIYPNPVRSDFTVDTRDFLGQDVIINIFNTIGLKIMPVYQGPVTLNEMSFSINSINDGNYFVVIQNKGLRKINQFIIQK